MTIAIKFGDSRDPNSISGVIYFDAVTKYTKTYGGQVATHPTEAGVSMADHYIANNKKFQISGVISDVDFSPLSTLVAFGGEGAINAATPPSPVSIGGISEWRNYIPDVVSQYLGTQYPKVNADRQERPNFALQVDNIIEELLHGLYYNPDRGKLENRATLVTLFEMEGSSVIPSKTIENLLITSFKVEEDEDSGTALFFEMVLEQIRIYSSERADAPNPAPNSKTSRQTSKSTNKGAQQMEPRPAPNDKRVTVRSEAENIYDLATGG